MCFHCSAVCLEIWFSLRKPADIKRISDLEKKKKTTKQGQVQHAVRAA